MALCKIRQQSMRQLVSAILRQEIKTFAELIEKVVDNPLMHFSLDSSTASRKRAVGRPRNYDARNFLQENRDKVLPPSMEAIIDEQLKE